MLQPDRPYQLLPPLEPEQYAALRADIEAHGIRVPVDVDEAGAILDGHHRAQIAAELGIDCPARVVSGLTEEEKRGHAVAVNAHRRALTREQRRALVEAEVERDPSRSDRAIARIVGVSHHTVAAVRRGGWAIAQPDGPDSEDTTVSAEEVATLAECEEVIDGHLSNVDSMILFALSRRVDPMTIVGWLTAAQHRLIALDPQSDGGALAVRVLFEPRISYLIKQGRALADRLSAAEPDAEPLTADDLATLATALSGGAS